MATETTFLKLKLPLNGEFQDTWDQPANENYEKIDTFADAVNTELTDARFGQASLKEFLEISIDNNGTLKPTDEMIKARSSFLYGDETTTPEDFGLGDRISEADKEIFKAREGQNSIRDLLALKQFFPDVVLKGSKNVNGYPTWLGFTGANAQVDGSSEDLSFLISGYVQRVRTLEQIGVSGAAGTYYLFAEFSEDGQIVVDGDSSSSPPASPTGSTGSDGSKVRIFEDLSVDFTSVDVKVGDAIDILGTGANAGRYLIREIAPNANNNRLMIFGVFPGGSLASLDYLIKDVVKPTLGVSATLTPTTNRLYIGEVDFDGAAITAVRALHFKDRFVSEWRAVDVSGSPTFSEVFNHNLFSDELEISVQVSQVNDGSGTIEQLSLSSIRNTLGIDVDNTIAHAADTFDPGTTDASFTQGAFTGDVTATITGDVDPGRSAGMQWTRTAITLKNLVDNLFYTDYSGAQQDTGYLRVVVSKRG